MPIMKVENFSFTYASASSPSLKGITLPIKKNKITALIGPSGCGKSTLLKLIDETIEPDDGEIIRQNGIKIKRLKKGNLISLKGQKNLYGFDYTVGSDPSSAAFLIALTLLTPGSKLVIHNVLCNDTRIFFLKVL